MAVSLCVVWYVAVILLGVATALLATSSTILDSIMDQQLQELIAQEEDEEGNVVDKMVVGEELRLKDTVAVIVDSNGTQIITNNNKGRATTTSGQRMQYPLVQKLTLVLMILVLFYSQMWFFEWIHSALSSLTASGLAVSTRLGLFGLFSSSIMVTLGARILPATVSTASTLGSRNR
ncbi:hypothetical protein BGZ96_010824 [Linnemannia gamsii]|uniref:Uncharacterized protein n=1 Tax=Linnemannia gamsii TaxID=64522 RepID=A0ABQ7JU76_9FUNG|nr:hypothetical protein BGZ96_010824 [Linnemannia gamsii]